MRDCLAAGRNVQHQIIIYLCVYLFIYEISSSSSLLHCKAKWYWVIWYHPGRSKLSGRAHALHSDGFRFNPCYLPLKGI